MRNPLGHYVSAAFLPWFLLGGATGCTGENETPSTSATEVDAGARPPLTGLRPVARDSVQPVEAFDAAGAAPIDIDATGAARLRAADGGALDAGPDAALPRCVPEGGVDEPDDAFADTNCDGIDGDASRAVFVAPTGSDDGSGTPDAPFKTLKKAVSNAAADGKSVYVCNGEYAENVQIVAAVSLYGGYDCSNGWKRIADRATIKPASGVPLTISDTFGSVVIERLELRAPNAGNSDYGSSSVAASVVRSDHVTFTRSALIAGEGGPGKVGEPAVPWTAPQSPAAAGQSLAQQDCVMENNRRIIQGGSAACSIVPKGGTGDPRWCFNDLVFGGEGGNGGNVAVLAVAEEGWEGVPSSSPLESGRSGTLGLDGLPGAASALGFGHIDGGRYVPDNEGKRATRGANGEAGFGGRGGESVGRGDVATTFWIGGGGGQGGYPGCGGAAGNPGGGGGASIALISDASGVRLEYSSLETSLGGQGGSGSEGAPGQRGGAGGPGGTGTGDTIFSGQTGGRGGDGGHGGAGGPGGGGPSVGAVWTGVAPTIHATTISLGPGGLGGVTSARVAAVGIVAEFYPPVRAGDAGLGGTQ